jgi:hypothetical protein
LHEARVFPALLQQQHAADRTGVTSAESRGMIIIFYALLLIGIAAGVSVLITSSLVRGRHDRSLAGPEGHMDDRLRRLEATVEAMAAELERMSEGQRFLTDVLTERRDAEARRIPPGSRKDEG